MRVTPAFASTVSAILPKRGDALRICTPGSLVQSAYIPRKPFVHTSNSVTRTAMVDTHRTDSTPVDDVRGENTVDALTFYGNYSGHPADQLAYILETRPEHTPVLFLAGDSTLDNKYWLASRDERHPNPHLRQCLSAGSIIRDVAYWLARVYASHEFTPINCAVEASTLRQRLRNGLLHQDELIRDHVGPNDVLVVSVGGNDIALAPTVATVFAVLMSVYRGGDAGMATLNGLFREGLEKYIAQLVSKRKPRLVVVCMLYFPDESSKDPSWASFTLRALRYNSHPDWLQSSIERVFEHAIKNITVEGCPVVFAPLFQALDGKNSDHYVARVEPSENGGNAIAALLKKVIDES